MQDLLSKGFEDLGLSDLMQVVEKLVQVKGRKLLDVGCGGGRLAKLLAAHGGEVVGVEPDPIQAQRNRDAEPIPGLSFHESGGETLPAEDASIDGVFYRYSLHHVPGELLEAALFEAARVLKPDGYLFAIEPLLSGNMQAVYAPFHDETFVRTRAYEALRTVAKPLFRQMREFRYGEMVRHDSFEAFRDRTLGMTYNSHQREKIDNPTVRALFEKGKTADGYLFDRYNRVNLFEGPVVQVS